MLLRGSSIPSRLAKEEEEEEKEEEEREAQIIMLCKQYFASSFGAQSRGFE